MRPGAGGPHNLTPDLLEFDMRKEFLKGPTRSLCGTFWFPGFFSVSSIPIIQSSKKRGIATNTRYWYSAVLLCFIVILFAKGVEGMENRARPQDPFIFEKNVAIPTDDDSLVMANVFRPKEAGRYPVIMSMSVYGKDLATKDLYAREWKEMNENIAGLCKQSSCRYHTWETLDPELWVPDGYVLIRVDARGAGKSPGTLDPFSPREIRDFYNP
jgi:predicted acyl esterase